MTDTDYLESLILGSLIKLFELNQELALELVSVNTAAIAKTLFDTDEISIEADDFILTIYLKE